MKRSALSDRFRKFAERECKDSSKLYEHLSANIATDVRLLELAAYSRSGQPVPNLLLGAVHFLLLQGTEHRLSQYYSSITDNPLEPAKAFPEFKDFCQENENEIRPILQKKLVQTNEVRRCAYLYPSFCYIHQITQKPLALIEIGTSAGLQLLWDQYRYSYNSAHEKYGNEQSTFEIKTEIKGDQLPLLLKHSPPVITRIGLDLHVNDLNDPEDYLWLKALIWPEHKERISYFEKAAAHLKRSTIQLIEGDGVTLLPDIVSNISKESTVCIFHTHVANQIPDEGKILLDKYIQEMAQERDVFHLYNNMWDLDLHLDYYLGRQAYNETLAETNGHGQWFKWKQQKTIHSSIMRNSIFE